MAISDLRKDYSLAGLHEKDLARDPFRQFDKWFQEAQAAKLPEPNAVTLSTSTPDGRPSSRIVLLKGVDGRGFVFFGNYESRKGRELALNPHASLAFPWFAFERQVIVDGTVARISREESAAYFHSRPRASQIGAWASPQSTVIADRQTLETNYKLMENKYAAADEIPLPAHWGGWRLTPVAIEFWQGRRSRLHDRLRYRRAENGEWFVERLAP